MPAVLFVCTANRYRSPIAAAIFQKMLQDEGKVDQWRVDSAGTWTIPGQPVIPLANQAAQKLGLDLSNHKTSLVSREMLSEYDLIVAMESGHKEALSSEFPSERNRLYLLSEIVDDILYDIPDPATTNEDVEDLAEELYGLIQRGYPKIYQLAQAIHESKS